MRELLGPGVVDVRLDEPMAPSSRRRRDHRGRSPQELFDEYLGGQGVVDDRVRTLFGELLDEALTP